MISAHRTPEAVVPLDWPVYAPVFNSPFSDETRLALCSFSRSPTNYVHVFRLVGPSVIPEGASPLEFPQTCCQFSPHPPGLGESADLLITGGDSLRIWQSTPTSLHRVNSVIVNTTADPITCLDWSPYERSIVVAGSTDATAAAIDLTESDVVTRVIAHDHPVQDVCFSDAATFTTAGYDGSMRYFDLRDLASSFIFYQAPLPLMKARVCPTDHTKIACFSSQSKAIVVIDSRRPGVPCATCVDATGTLTGIGWEKLGSSHLYATDTSGTVLLASLENQAPKMGAQVWYRGEDPVESLAMGQGVIAVAHGQKVDIVEGFKHVGATFPFE
jgi:WD40 repeat protein